MEDKTVKSISVFRWRLSYFQKYNYYLNTLKLSLWSCWLIGFIRDDEGETPWFLLLAVWRFWTQAGLLNYHFRGEEIILLKIKWRELGVMRSGVTFWMMKRAASFWIAIRVSYSIKVRQSGVSFAILVYLHYLLWQFRCCYCLWPYHKSFWMVASIS